MIRRSRVEADPDVLLRWQLDVIQRALRLRAAGKLPVLWVDNFCVSIQWQPWMEREPISMETLQAMVELAEVARRPMASAGALGARESVA